MIINYIDIAGKALQNTKSEDCDQNELFRIFKWFFCEILIEMNNLGKNELHGFLEKNVDNTENLEDVFEAELLQFYMLGNMLDAGFMNKIEINSALLDIYPEIYKNSINFSEVSPREYIYNQDLTRFPILACNQDYLISVLNIIKNQINSIEVLYNEKEELLKFDVSQLNLPSLSDPRLPDVMGKTAYRSFKELTEETQSSPLHNYHNSFESLSLRIPSSSPELIQNIYLNKLNSGSGFGQTEIRRKEVIQIDRSNLDAKEYTFRKPKENNVKKVLNFYHQKISKMKELKTKRSFFKIWREWKMNTRKLENFKSKKSDKKIRNLLKAWQRIVKIKLLRQNKLKQILLKKHVKIWKQNVTLGLEMSLAVSVSHDCLRILKKPFKAFLYNYLISQANLKRAISYNTSRHKLDSFYALKSYVNQKKLNRRNLLKKSISSDRNLMNHILNNWKIQCYKIPNQPDKKYTKEINNLLLKLIKSENNIKKLWKIIKFNNMRCNCEGKKCEICVDEKAKLISHELSLIKREILKNSLKH